MAALNREQLYELARFAKWKSRPRTHTQDSEEDPRPQQVYGQLMKSTFAPPLRSARMKGSGGRFELPSEADWSLLGFQKSADSDSVELRFTINLLVVNRQVWADQIAEKPYLGKKPKAGILYGSWVDQTRIGRLTPSGDDLWWRLRRGCDPTPVVAEVLAMLTELAVPWLKQKTRHDLM